MRRPSTPAVGRPLPLVLLLTALTALAGAPAAPLAAQKSLILERLHAEIQVQESGDLLVEETLRPRFTGEWNGIARRIVQRHTTAAGAQERLRVEPLSATDGEGHPLRMESRQVETDVLEIRVWVPDARDRTAHVVLSYRVQGAIRYFAGDPEASPGSRDFDELYWEVTGTGWEVPIHDASVRIRLPAGAEVLQAAAYRGIEGSNEPVEVGVAGGRVAVAPGEVVVPSSGHLRPGQGLTVAVAWPAGLVTKPADVVRSTPVHFGPTGSVTTAAGGAAASLRGAGPRALLPLALPFLVFWLAYRAWARRGRDPRERAITVRWDPPAELGPAEAGTLVDHDPGMHDIIATLVDLAVRGYVVIAERKKKGFLRSGEDYALHLVRPRTEWDGLTRHEGLFLNGLFKGSPRSQVLANLAEEGSFLDGLLESMGGEPSSDSAPPGAIESVFLSDLQNRFYKEVPAIRDALLEALVAKGYYLRRPDRVRALWGILAAGTLLLGGATAVFAFGTGTTTGAAFGIVMAGASVASALILGIFALLMPARTEQGARTREAALGFKRFLERVEGPRYRRMIRSPDQFEQYLPYAMAFRCEGRWAEAFDDLITEPPDWYRGHHGTFRPTVFARDLHTLASTASSTMASSPSSSGSSGGGSVGGGSGGGGGGGF